MNAIELVEKQLHAYNNHDIDSFCECFAEDIMVYKGLEKALHIKGMDSFRKGYMARFEEGRIKAEIKNRMQVGNIIIDHERVHGLAEEIIEAIAVYEVKGDKISEVLFLGL